MTDFWTTETMGVAAKPCECDADKLRWLDTVCHGQYLPSLSVNYDAINKDLEKLTPQLY